MACSHIDSTLSIFSFCRPLLELTVFSHTRRKAMFFIRKWGPVFEGAEHAWTWWLRWWQIGWARSKEQVKGKEVGRFFGSGGSSFFGGRNAKRGRTGEWVFLKKGFSEKGFLCLGRKLPECEFFWKRGFLRRFLFFWSSRRSCYWRGISRYVSYPSLLFLLLFALLYSLLSFI